MTTCWSKLDIIDRRNGWFGRRDDFIEECEDFLLEVVAINNEYAEVFDTETEETCLVYFGGTSRTITIERIREI